MDPANAIKTRIKELEKELALNQKALSLYVQSTSPNVGSLPYTGLADSLTEWFKDNDRPQGWTAVQVANYLNENSNAVLKALRQSRKFVQVDEGRRNQHFRLRDQVPGTRAEAKAEVRVTTNPVTTKVKSKPKSKAKSLHMKGNPGAKVLKERARANQNLVREFAKKHLRFLKTDVMTTLDLSESQVSLCIKNLIDANVLVEDGTARREGGGRKPKVYKSLIFGNQTDPPRPGTTVVHPGEGTRQQGQSWPK